MRIYVASLTDYNNGVLHGTWIDLENKDYDEVMEEIQEMLNESPEAPEGSEYPAEEWAIHDYEAGIHISEYEDIRELVELQEAFDEFEEEAVIAFIDYFGGWNKEAFQEAYCGDYSYAHEPMEAYAQQLYEDCYEIPEHLIMYIAWDRVARDLSIDHYEENGHIFRTV